MYLKSLSAGQDMCTIGTCRRERGGRVEMGRMQAAGAFRVPAVSCWHSAVVKALPRPRYRDKWRMAVHGTRLAMGRTGRERPLRP